MRSSGRRGPRRDPSSAPLRDHDASRPEYPVTESVSLLEHLDDGTLFRLGRLRQQRLVDVRVELPVSLDLVETFSLERRAKLARDERNALGELRLLMLLARLERTLEVVQYGEQLLHQPLVCARGQAFLVARDTLAVVVEVRRHPLQVVDGLVPFGLEERHALIESRVSLGGLLRGWAAGLFLGRGHYECLAPSSSSMTS